MYKLLGNKMNSPQGARRHKLYVGFSEETVHD